MGNMRIRTKLRGLRAERGFSQIDLALRTKIAENRYWRIENGYVTPTPQEQARLARALGTTPEALFPAAVARSA